MDEDFLLMYYVMAKELAHDRGIKIRIYRLDGNPMIVTADYRTDRLNVYVDDGVITKIVGRG
jgi:hypothetical protein